MQYALYRKGRMQYAPTMLQQTRKFRLTYVILLATGKAR